jgi:hypothetical protein
VETKRIEELMMNEHEVHLHITRKTPTLHPLKGIIDVAQCCCSQIGSRQPPQENSFVDSGGWLIVFEIATALRCFAERYTQAKNHFDKAFCGTSNSRNQKVVLCGNHITRRSCLRTEQGR